MTQAEIWKSVKGYEGFYEVSNLGRVKSLNRVVIAKDGRSIPIAERILINCKKKSTQKELKYYLSLGLSRNSKLKNHYVHRLVAGSFLPNIHNHPEVNHKDKNTENCHVSNLEWVSSLENTKHKMKDGTSYMSRGSKAGRAKLDEDLVGEIIVLLKGRSNASLGREFSVDPSIISLIRSNKIWKHVKGERSTSGRYQGRGSSI